MTCGSVFREELNGFWHDVTVIGEHLPVAGSVPLVLGTFIHFAYAYFQVDQLPYLPRSAYEP